MYSTDIYLFVLCLALFVALVRSWLASRTSKNLVPLPPSPPSDPLIGHMRLLMGATDISKEYTKWSRKLGSDIISFNILGGTVIVLNSLNAAEDLLVKRSSIYSDRPQVHNTMSTSDRLMAGSSIIKVVYGYEATTSNDTLFDIVSRAVDGFSRSAITSNFYVNVIPWMQYIPAWFPGAEWKRKALVWRWQTEQMLHVPYNWTRDKMSTGTAPPSMLKHLLSKYAKEPSKEEKDTILWATGTLFAAGTDTTVASTLVFIVAMAMHPEVQAKAQAEVDSVLCGKRFPEIEDRQSMPHVN
ncbi:unnamed protein product [Rhizoctonia solani]|uniref:O-methylsterigmatocystin oxidoreductase n=1 Tax=Rhizoctonia solani TaxID=456999 RepID=A0A8H3C9I7_9AGAM|nr:unnamed protein product [Rhizoctonia solani]